MTIQLFFKTKYYILYRNNFCAHIKGKKYMFFKSCEDWVTIHSFYLHRKQRASFSQVYCVRRRTLKLQFI